MLNFKVILKRLCLNERKKKKITMVLYLRIIALGFGERKNNKICSDV